jgi:hypothetical protein
MYVLRIPLKLAALGWPFIVTIVASTMAAAAGIASASSTLNAIAALYLAPTCIFAAATWIIFVLVRAFSSPPGSPRMSLDFLLHSAAVTIRLACLAFYFILNIMHYVPLVLAALPVSSLPPPPNRSALFSILPVTVFITPILLFLINNAGLFLLGLYTVTPPPEIAAAAARSQFSTLLTHPAPLLKSVASAGKPFPRCLRAVFEFCNSLSWPRVLIPCSSSRRVRLFRRCPPRPCHELATPESRQNCQRAGWLLHLAVIVSCGARITILILIAQGLRFDIEVLGRRLTLWECVI